MTYPQYELDNNSAHINDNPPTGRTAWRSRAIAAIAIVGLLGAGTIGAPVDAAQAAPVATPAAVVAAPATLHVSSVLKKRVTAYSKKRSVPVTASTKKVARAYARTLLAKKYASPTKAARQYQCLSKVFSYESGWNWRSRAASGYYGIPQTRTNMAGYEHGAQNWRTHYEPQIRFGFAYMVKRYGSPCGAWAHIQSHGWY